MKNICTVITARPSYSRIKTALDAIKNHKDLNLQLVVAATALLPRFGNAVEQIEKDGFEIHAKVQMVVEGNSPSAMVKTTGMGLIELSTVFDNLKPDAVITIADRFETMATALTASYMNIPLVHIQGGEITGSIDDKVRHSITKLANYHLVSTDEAAKRVIKMGESPEVVFNVGCPSIDLASEVLKDYKLDFNPFEKYGGVGSSFPLDNYIVVMQHPITTEYKEALQQINETLFAIKETGIPCFWFWPNVDAGSDDTSKGIRVFRELQNPENIHFFRNMAPKDFLKLIKNSKCLIGNSSVGIRESSFLGVPVVNIGSRQQRRERGPNVIDTGHDRNEIKAAIQKHIKNGHYESCTIYGNGNAGEKCADVLSKIEFSYPKIMSY